MEQFPAVRYIFFERQKAAQKRMPLPSGLGICAKITNCFQKKSPTEAGLKIFIYGI
jgi:hypothetical protein